jgi:hypothetical protein
MQYGLIEACDLVGFPNSHGAAFQEVADAQSTVLVSRELGMYATGLVEEGYASKGYHNKTKTCAWGPMAGFVLADPHFGKASATEAGIAEQAERIFAALNKGARTVPVLISDFRRQWLEAFGLIRRVAVPSVNEIVYVAQPGPGVLGEVAALRFILRRMWGVPDASGLLWFVAYRDAAGREAPVEAMVDPLCENDVRGTYRSASTGDYDLFAVWPHRSNWRPATEDKRRISPFELFGGQFNLRDPLQRTIVENALDAFEDPDLGNVTPRVMHMIHLLNEAIRRRGYRGGAMVHHSDEAARPFIPGVELPLIGFIPNSNIGPFGIETLRDLSVFIQWAHQGRYVTVINPQWRDQIVAAHYATGYYQ